MQINISGRGLKITGPIREYVQKKIVKLEEFFKNIQKVEVVLAAHTIDNIDKRQVAEIRAWVGGLKEIQASEGGRDVYAAFDLALEEAKRQIERHKEKHVKENRRKASKFKQVMRNPLGI